MNNLITIFCLFFIVSCTIEKKDENPHETTVIKSGSTIFSERCTSCHGMDGKLGFGGAKDLTKSIKSLAEIESQVTNGKGAMAPYKNILSLEEIAAVSEHALRLQKK
jgi:mono/diheme cytochrome c family protein